MICGGPLEETRTHIFRAVNDGSRTGVVAAIEGHIPEDHHILGDGARLVTEDEADLTQLLGDGQRATADPLVLHLSSLAQY